MNFSPLSASAFCRPFACSFHTCTCVRVYVVVITMWSSDIFCSRFGKQSVRTSSQCILNGGVAAHLSSIACLGSPRERIPFQVTLCIFVHIIKIPFVRPRYRTFPHFMNNFEIAKTLVGLRNNRDIAATECKSICMHLIENYYG